MKSVPTFFNPSGPRQVQPLMIPMGQPSMSMIVPPPPPPPPPQTAPTSICSSKNDHLLNDHLSFTSNHPSGSAYNNNSIDSNEHPKNHPAPPPPPPPSSSSLESTIDDEIREYLRELLNVVREMSNEKELSKKFGKIRDKKYSELKLINRKTINQQQSIAILSFLKIDLLLTEDDGNEYLLFLHDYQTWIMEEENKKKKLQFTAKKLLSRSITAPPAPPIAPPPPTIPREVEIPNLVRIHNYEKPVEEKKKEKNIKPFTSKSLGNEKMKINFSLKAKISQTNTKNPLTPISTETVTPKNVFADIENRTIERSPSKSSIDDVNNSELNRMFVDESEDDEKLSSFHRFSDRSEESKNHEKPSPRKKERRNHHHRHRKSPSIRSKHNRRSIRSSSYRHSESSDDSSLDRRHEKKKSRKHHSGHRREHKHRDYSDHHNRRRHESGERKTSHRKRPK
ncbi:hypothetical protein SNEBB_005958 [Seison nebaliae]|nr:hypothetical protein SNEBB_005958 [Seison nebaliae]